MTHNSTKIRMAKQHRRLAGTLTRQAPAPLDHATILFQNLVQVLRHIWRWHRRLRENNVDALNLFLSILDGVSHELFLLQVVAEGVVHVSRELAVDALHESATVLETHLHRLHHLAEHLLSPEVSLQQLANILHLRPQEHHLVEQPLRLLGVLLRKLCHHLLAQLAGHITESGRGLLSRWHGDAAQTMLSYPGGRHLKQTWT